MTKGKSPDPVALAIGFVRLHARRDPRFAKGPDKARIIEARDIVAAHDRRAGDGGAVQSVWDRISGYVMQDGRPFAAYFDKGDDKIAFCHAILSATLAPAVVPAAACPAAPTALDAAIAELEAFERDGTILDEIDDWAGFCECVTLCLHELKRLRGISSDTIPQRGDWLDMAYAPMHDGAKIIGHDAKWGVAEMMLDGAKRWVLATFNGQIIFCEPLKWLPLPAAPDNARGGRSHG